LIDFSMFVLLVMTWFWTFPNWKTETSELKAGRHIRAKVSANPFKDGIDVELTVRRKLEEK